MTRCAWGLLLLALVVPRAALAQEMDAGKIDALIRKMDDDDPTVREEATKELIKIGAPALKPLSRALNHASAEVRERTKRVLASFRYDDPAFMLTLDGQGADALPTLKEILKKNNSSERLLAIDALGRVGGDEALALLESLQSNADADVRVETARALARFKTEKATAAIRGMVSDADPRVKASALKALGEAGDDASIPSLLAQLKDSNPVIFSAANDALIDLAKPANIPAFAKGLEDDDAFVKRICVSILGRIGDKAGLGAARTLYAGTKDEKVRRDAEWALREIAKKNDDLRKEIDALLGGKEK